MRENNKYAITQAPPLGGWGGIVLAAVAAIIIRVKQVT